ncbi:MAG: ScpA family protein [Longimicrobiales bacterium]
MVDVTRGNSGAGAQAEGAFGDGGFVVELDRFQGPLDLLLHLIREQDIDIFDIPISQITQQFLLAMGDVNTLGLDRAGEFLEMAALLIRIKAQMLMPRRIDASGELEDPRAELVRRLLEYEHFRDAAMRFEESQLDRLRRYARGYVPPRKEPTVVTELELTWDEVFSAAIGLGSRPKPPEAHHVTQRAVPVEEKIILILATLARLSRVEFRRLTAPFDDKLHSVVTLLGALELAKRRELSMRQREPFTELWLYKTQESLTDATDADH